jgi:hypothetical protein
LAIAWAIYLYCISLSDHTATASLVACIFQILFTYFYLELLHNLDHTIFTYLLVMFVGAVVLAFLYSFVYLSAGGQLA